jgi:hypothetical protein
MPSCEDILDSRQVSFTDITAVNFITEVNHENKQDRSCSLAEAKGALPHCPSQPINIQRTMAPVRFLAQLYAILADERHADCISWNVEGTSFTVFNPNDFQQNVLPKFFKTTKFASFQRQLNYFGFQKLRQRGYSYAHTLFMKGRRDLLVDIKRKQNTGQN